jgi:hypothetical protein
MRKTAAELTKSEIVEMLARFIAQRPGIEPGNYHDYASYRSESREVTKDRHVAESLLDAVANREGITADAMRAELMGSGRLTLSEDGRLDYCTGQYFPTEYRKAAARALASMLWAYWREDITQARARSLVSFPACGGGIGDAIRAEAKRTFRNRAVLRYFK